MQYIVIYITIYWMIVSMLQMINVNGSITENKEIKSQLNGKCLDIIGSSGNVAMWYCDNYNDNTQKWNYNPTTKEIKNINGKCLDVAGGVNEDGTNVRIKDCTGFYATQKWILNSNGEIQHHNGRCLNIENNNFFEGANVNIWSCNSGKNQLWYGPFLPVSIQSSTTITIDIRKEQNYDEIWNDEDSGSDLDGAFWKPKLNYHLGESFVSFVNTVGYHEPTDIVSIIITAAPSNALADPIDYQLIWDDSGSGGDHDVWFYKPIPPIGYECFGDFVSRSSIINSWDTEGYKCIHEDYINVFTADQVEQIEKWNDKGSGSDNDGQVIQINVNGLPDQYFRMSNKYGNSINEPFYTFNQYSNKCEIIKIESDNDLSNQILYGTADTSIEVTYNNYKTILDETKGFGQNECITSSSSFTHTGGSKMSITTTYGYKKEVGMDIEGVSASYEESFELSIEGEIYSEYSETTTTSQEICTDIPEQEVLCPGRTHCKREYIVFTAPNTIIPVEVTVQCGINTDIIEGKFTATGAASILVQDTFFPLDCIYYTDDYDDRGNGKLPFCDTCSPSNPNICYICRDGMVLIDGDCWDDRICIEECKGQIESPSQTVPRSTSPDFAGRYCINEDTTLQSCKTALRRT